MAADYTVRGCLSSSRAMLGGMSDAQETGPLR